MVSSPSLVREAQVGERANVSVNYFYEEDAPGASYDNLGFLVDEILVALASSAAGVISISEGALSNIASGHTPLHNQLYQFIDHHIDTNTVGRPHAYLVYMAFDNRNRLVPGNSGVIQVSDPNQLRTILTNEIVVKQDGYMHTYVSNGSSNKGVSFNDFMMTAVTGKTRQINHYYPYGLPIPEINEIRTDYLNKYTGKEHQTREYEERGLQAKGLEMFDFHARFWEPQLARWTSPDPAAQFSNPYLGMGNNPAMYVHPNGEWIDLASSIIMSGVLGGVNSENFGGRFFDGFLTGIANFGFSQIAGDFIQNLAGSMPANTAQSQIAH